MLKAPVQAAKWKQNDDQIGNRVPKLSNIACHLVIGLAPINSGRVVLPKAVKLPIHTHFFAKYKASLFLIFSLYS
jgi:hypothetical protein